MPTRRAVAVLFGVLLLATPALAHVPAFPTENTSPERAVRVPEPTKSWSFYDRLDGDVVAYYRFDLAAGEQLAVGTFAPAGSPVTAGTVVMSPAIDERGDVPPGVVVPEGYGATVIRGERTAAPELEPFTPAAITPTASHDRTFASDTTVLLAVVDEHHRSGPVGVVIGSEESFSVLEYATVPFQLVRVYTWSGQHPLLAIGPFLLAVLAGAAFAWHRSRTTRVSGTDAIGVIDASGTADAAGVLGGLLVLGTGANTAVQLLLALLETGPAPAALVTIVLVAVPSLVGAWAVREGLRGATDRSVSAPRHRQAARAARRRRIGYALGGVLALATWGGYLIGPALLLVAAVATRPVDR